MLQLAFPRVRLSVHAFIISASLVILVGLLGAKAYSVARLHFAQISGLINHDVRAKELLVGIQATLPLRDLARQKYEITRDSAYLDLERSYDRQIESLSAQMRETLGDDWPSVLTEKDARGLRSRLEQRWNSKLQEARGAALGLLRMIGLAVLLSLGITIWLLTLLYQGLIQPLGRIRDATRQVGDGDFKARVNTKGGVDELHQLSASFNQMAEHLEALDRSKTEFLATVSHEIKNPLAALKEGLSFLGNKGDGLAPAARTRAFAACLIASKRLESIIDNLLYHSKMEMGWGKPGEKEKNLHDLILSSAEEVRLLADRRGMEIEVAGEQNLLVPFDSQGMQQVLINLFTNAVKYGQEGCPIEVNSRLISRSIGESGPIVPHVEVQVTNRGQEIPESELKKVFERFYRADNCAEQKGMGLGLYVVKQVIERHRGGVRAISSGGKTSVQFWIPSRIPQAQQGVGA